MAQPPIPVELPSLEGWQSVPIEPSGEPLVAVGLGTPYRLYTDSLYAAERSTSPYSIGLEGSLNTVFVRRSTAERLLTAEAALPPGWRLLIADGYRPQRVQEQLYDSFIDKLRELHPDWADTRLAEVTQRYVSLPSANSDAPAPHSSGGAVDVALYRLPEAVAAQLPLTATTAWANLIAEHGQAVDFGVPLDFGGPQAALNFYEQLAAVRPLSSVEQAATEHRRLLYRVMIGAGFEPYAPEWWHFNAPESQMGSKAAGRPVAKLDAIELSAANREQEDLHRTWLGELTRQSQTWLATTIKPTPETGREQFSDTHQGDTIGGMTIMPTTLQSLIEVLGPEQALRNCSPVAFYMLLQAAGYLDDDLTAVEFCQLLNRESLATDKYNHDDWSRPALSKLLRQRYGAAIVSWQLQGAQPPNIAKMREAGYIETSVEEHFFLDQVAEHSVKELVAAGYPVIVTMKPNFGETGGTNIHAVIILDWEDDEVRVIDPDGRNLQTHFSADYIQSYLFEHGAGTIALPRNYRAEAEEQ